MIDGDLGRCRTWHVRRLLLVVIVASSCAHGVPAPSAPSRFEGADACRGSKLEVDAALTRCTVRDAPRPVPSAALRIDVVPPEVTAESGGEPQIAIWVTNATVKPLALDLVVDCDPFEVSTYMADGRTRVDLAEPAECPMEVPANVSEEVACLPGDPVRVTLEPGGRLVKRLAVEAHSHRLSRWRGACVREYGHGFPPGRYLARVKLPFLTEHPSLEVPMIVTKPFEFPQTASGLTGAP